MVSIEETNEAVVDTARRWRPDRELRDIAPLTPDASLRRYFRLTFDTMPTAIACVFDSLTVPEATSDTVWNSFAATVELARFFAAHDVPVPQLYFSVEHPPILLLEDLGDRTLSAALLSGDAELVRWYKEAIDIIGRIQRLERQPGFFAFQRSFTAAVYLREMSEFTDYVLSDDASRRTLEPAFVALAEELSRFPLALAHRDFHSWNLMIDSSSHVRVIDFQDALLAPLPYDLVGLLNDRDTDSLLGATRYVELVRYFWRALGGGADFWHQYDCTLLQRDFKVSGRFSKLVKVRGLESYGRWIGGTLRRIGRTLARLVESGSQEYRPALELLVRTLPEARSGAETPLELRPRE